MSLGDAKRLPGAGASGTEDAPGGWRRTALPPIMRLALALLLVLAGCGVEDASPLPPAPDDAVTPAPPVDTSAASPTLGDETNCYLVATDTVAAYARPSAEAARFGTLAVGDSLAVGARAANGWLGFAPGTAQAANVGPFRLRYVAPDAPVRLTGAGCDALPTVPALPPRTCFFMAMGATDAHAAPDTAAAVVATVAAQGYAEVARRTDAGWAEVLLLDGTGWIAPADGNFSGDCEGLVGR